VIALDTNVLVAAHRQDADRHERAAASLRSIVESGSPWAITWSSLHEFLAIVTHPRIYDPPSTLAQAIGQIELWSESPTLVLLGERSDHWEHIRPLLVDGDIRGARVHDARIAAICLAHGVTVLWTADRDFGRFPQLRTSNPLVG
jgi:toxin-antitoxin system PIN domain toxin